MSVLSQLLRAPEGTSTRFGWSFISEFRECPRQWFFHHLRPHESEMGVVDGHGCAPVARGGALALGSLFHAGIDGWYRSGYDLLEACRAIHETAAGVEMQRAENLDTLVLDAHALITRHHEWFGPEGHKPERKTHTPLLDGAGELMIEREFDVPLGYGDYRFTTRTDLLMSRVADDAIEIWEHKTCDASRQANALREYSLSGQFTGQQWCVATAWPEVVERLAAPVVNLVIKRAAKGREPRQLVVNPRYPEDLEAFRLGVIRTLKRMEASIEEWHHLCLTGMDAHDAGMMVFEGEPKGIVCAGAFSAPCSYSPACAVKRFAKSWFRQQTIAQVKGEITK